MKSKRKFYRQIVTVEVLSENPIDPVNIGDLAFMITDGDCSGSVEWQRRQVLSASQAAKALIRQGSDPEFFFLNHKGEDLPD